MIRSMTAYASAEAAIPGGVLACELRTVNHRYLEVSPRLPDELRYAESMLRERVAARLSRGKVDINVRLRTEEGRGESLEVDRALLMRLAQLHGEVAAQFPQVRVEFADLLRFPGVLQQPEADRDLQQASLMQVLDETLDTLSATREREGEKLGVLLTERLDAIAGIVTEVRTLMPQIRAALRARLQSRLADITMPAGASAPDPGRLEQELVLQITRSDVDEELDRLTAHISEARRVLGLAEPVGRRLDFLMQEFNREANTLGSKSVDARSTKAAVELKVLIEQMREQVQNIE